MLPVEHNDPVNAKILAISEDKIEGFVREPFVEIANRSGIGVDVVMARIAAMLRAGTIRRVRQTLLATNLAEGALVAWKVPEETIDAAFDWMFQHDPFSGHVVLRSTDTASAGSDYKLWTTVKFPHGFFSPAIRNALPVKIRGGPLQWSKVCSQTQRWQCPWNAARRVPKKDRVETSNRRRRRSFPRELSTLPTRPRPDLSQAKFVGRAVSFPRVTSRQSGP